MHQAFEIGDLVVATSHHPPIDWQSLEYIEAWYKQPVMEVLGFMDRRLEDYIIVSFPVGIGTVAVNIKYLKLAYSV